MPKSTLVNLGLQKPELVEAKGQPEVDSRELLSGGNVSVYYLDIQENDLIQLPLPLADSGYPQLEPKHGRDKDDQGIIKFHVPPEYIALWLGLEVGFAYTVTRGDDVQTSLVGRVKIKMPSNLAVVQIFKTVGDKLDLSFLCCEDPVFYIPPWAFANTHQTINVYLGGIKPDGTQAPLYPFEGAKVTEEDVRSGWKRSFSLQMLQELKHDSELYVSGWVRFSSFTNYQLFGSRVLTLLTEPHLELDAPEVCHAVECSPGKFLLNPLNVTGGATLRVDYGHPCSADYVCAYWTGTAGPGTPYLACKEVGPDGVVEFAIPVSAISANFKEKVSVHFTVLRNGRTWPSASRDIHIQNISGLPRPRVTQATGSALDLNTVSGDPEVVVIPWCFIDTAHPCWLWITGTLEDGTSYSYEVLRGESGPLAGVIETLPRCELQKLADCRPVRVHFAVNFKGELDKAGAEEFPVLELKLVQEELVLKAPKVCEAVGSQLTAENGGKGVTVRVEYERINANQQISVCWTRLDGSCLPLEPKPGNSDDKYVEFAIHGEAVIQRMGKTVPINYTVTTPCKRQTSKDLDLVISRPVRLPDVSIRERTGNILDLAAFPGDAHVIVDPWWFILPKQRALVKGSGTRKDGTPYTFDILPVREITSDEVRDGLLVAASRTELALLKHDTPLTITCTVVTNEVDPVNEGITFTSPAFTIRQTLTREQETFEAQTEGVYAAGHSLQTPLMKIDFLSGSGKAGITSYHTNELASGKHYTVCDNADWQKPSQLHLFTFKHPLESVKFSCVSLQRPATFTFKDSLGGVIKVVSASGDQPWGFWVECIAPTGRSIQTLELSVQDWAFLDNFTACYRH